MVEEIKALKELLDIGAITQEEFDKKKAELLAASNGAGASPKQAQSSTRIANNSSKSKVAAGLLAIFLGGLGIHKFYLGYSAEGIIMLLVSILGGFLFMLGPVAMGIIALIEGIIYLTKSDEAFEATYVQGHKGWF